MSGLHHRRHATWGGLIAIVAAVFCLGLVSRHRAGGEAVEGRQARGRRQAGSRRAGLQRPGRPGEQDLRCPEWTFAEYIGFGTDAATQARLEEVLAFLSKTGYRNVELFTLSGLTAEQIARPARQVRPEGEVAPRGRRHAGESVGLRADPGGQQDPRRHVLRHPARRRSSRSIYTTEAEWIAYAEYLDELGAQARKAGQKLMVHNHDVEFETVFGDQSVYDILVANTDPRNVVFQVDLYWSTRGLGVASGATSVDEADDLSADLLRQLRNRVQLAHVKDMATGTFPGRIEIVGEGGIDFPALFDCDPPSAPLLRDRARPALRRSDVRSVRGRRDRFRVPPLRALLAHGR